MRLQPADANAAPPRTSVLMEEAAPLSAQRPVIWIVLWSEREGVCVRKYCGESVGGTPTQSMGQYEGNGLEIERVRSERIPAIYDVLGVRPRSAPLMQRCQWHNPK